MKRARRVSLLVLAAILTAPIALAQDFGPALMKSTPTERAKIQTGLMKEKLHLTEQQVPKVEAINLEVAQKLEPVLKGSDGPLVKMRSVRAAEQEKEKALQAVLTPEQFQGFLAMREEMRQKLEERLAEKKQAETAPSATSP